MHSNSTMGRAMITRRHLRWTAAFCGILLGATALAPGRAEARVHVFVGGFFGPPAYYYPPYPPYYYYPPAYYPPAYYYPPPPVVYAPTPAYASPPPPPPAATAPPKPLQPGSSSRKSSEKNCRQFDRTAPDGSAQPGRGTACQQPDGSWKIVN